MAESSQEIIDYFDLLESKLNHAYDIANKARKKNYDPENRVDIPIAKNMAERVEGLISAVAPELSGSGMIGRIIELEKEYGALSWQVALKISEEVAKEKFCKFSDVRKAMEVAIRVGFAYHTCGIVAAPLEGFVELKLKKRKDGKEYLAAFYSGPIRGAGGTAASFSVILTDYVRSVMGYEKWDPTEEEINRCCMEVQDYHERVTNLQYFPSREEIEFMVRHLPIEVEGDPTENIDVSNFKDLERIETNRIRGGVCLVLAEGLCQKSPKLWKRLAVWGKQMGVDWDFLAEFLDIQKKIKAGKQLADTGEKPKLSLNYTFIADLVAGRPILTYPMAEGGFRLRYGRTRLSGFSACGIHPCTEYVLNKYIATGTQLKVERPGKAAAVTPCDSIEPPLVKLENGDVLYFDYESQAKEILPKLKEVLYLGDILFNYGDFSENGHILIPPGYCEEWYVLELERAAVDLFGNIDVDKLSELINLSAEKIDLLLKDPFTNKLTAKAAIDISQKLKVPLYPKYSYYWKLISYNDLLSVIEYMNHAKYEKDKFIEKIILPLDEGKKRILEILGVPHRVIQNEFVVIEKDNALAFSFSLGISEKEDLGRTREIILQNKDKNPLEIINIISDIKIRDKAGTFIGARMGRPEKAKQRKLTGSPHCLFPVGAQGGKFKSFQETMQAGKIEADFPIYKCTTCNKETIYHICETCDNLTVKFYFCKTCGTRETQNCHIHGPCFSYKKKTIEIGDIFSKALKKLKMDTYPDLIKGVAGTSNKDHIPENIIKGILRSKHDIHVNKDGTTRYDMSEVPMTHFIPKEIGLGVDKLKELGYTHDIYGGDLFNDEQIIELKPQDVILPSCADSTDEPADLVLFKVANFIDDLLEKFYGIPRYYNLKKKDELIGHLIIGLAPHISAGICGRIIGFSKTQGMFCHPLFHAAMRRDCDGDEACAMLMLDAFLNFSRQFLPDRRGSRTMDSCLVLTTRLIPSEVDDQALGVDVVGRYPLEFYEAALNYRPASEVKIEQIRHRLGTPKQYEGVLYTHPISNMNLGIRCSDYKTLPSMEEKLNGQMQIAEKLRAVDHNNVAKLVIEKHFLKDIKGNLRKFSTQEFRCVACNEKYRRPPLVGQCTKCKGKIIFTISEGSVIKYLEPTLSLAKKYDLQPYLKQTLDIIQLQAESVFGRDKEKQTGLGAWFG